MQTAYLFTGQGSQWAGMGKELAARFPAAQATFDEASEALGEDLTKLCFEGPEDQLAMTEHTQPATLAVSLAAYRCLDAKPDLAAGHSLGEYSALTAAGSFALADAVRLVRARATFMQNAVPVGVGGMVVLRKMNLDEAREVAGKVRAGVCDIANINAPGQIVLSGEAAAMDEVMEIVGPRKGMRLKVSVPFHSTMLRAAGEEYAAHLKGVEIADPAFPIYCNVDASPVRTSAEVRDGLERQFANSVLWQTSVERMLEAGVRRFVECGPKPTLVRMVTQIANAVSAEGVEAVAATTVEEIEALVG